MLSVRLLERLKHDSAVVRQDAWMQLQRDFIAEAVPTRREVLLCLLDVQAGERDMIVWQTAARTLALASILQFDEDKAMDGLGQWLWDPFRRHSLVLRVAESHRLRRDEDAVIELARYLSRKEFPLAGFPRVNLGDFTPVVDEMEVNAICFVGRLSLYGQDAVDSWSMKGRRFRFNIEERPKTLNRGALHPEYHVVLEEMGKYDDPIRYPTTENSGKRTDYGLLQRHVVRRNNRDIVVLLCAGCSALGTLAAAYWAAHDLFVPNHDGKLLPLPDGIPSDCRLEALVEATADTTLSTQAWELSEVKLLDLRLDGQAWYETGYKWDRPAPKKIGLLHASGSKGACPNESVTDVLLDGQPAALRKRNENWRLFVAMCRLAYGHGGRVDAHALAKDEWVWRRCLKGSKHNQVKHAKARLSNLKTNHLVKALTLGEDECRLNAEVRYHSV